MNKFLSLKIRSPFIIAFIVFVFGVGFLFGVKITEEELYYYDRKEFSLFFRAINLIEDKYIYSDSLDYSKLIQGAISGMIKSLDDYPSVFFTPEERTRFLEDSRGNFEGVGMEITIKDNQLQVVTPLEGTPAEREGIKARDYILKIDGKDTFNMKAEEAVSLIRGERGTEVVLTIMRENWDIPQEISIIRDLVEIPSMRLNFISEDGLNIAHIRLIHFSMKASSDFSKISREIISNNPDGIILDLRNNPGGYLDEAKKIAEWFLNEGDIIAIKEGKSREVEYTSRKDGQLSSFPIVILINQGSASASEILALSIKENMDTKIIGEKSFGKGSVQELVTLRDGSAIKITVGKWLSPEGRLIEGEGIIPDIIVEFDLESDKDNQLEEAIKLLKVN